MAISDQITALTKILNNKEEKILVISHRNPDGDAMGSSLGLYNLINLLGIKCNVLLPNNFAKYYQWMPSATETTIFMNEKEKGTKLINEATTIIAVDFNDTSRVKEFKKELELAQAKKVLIDHHPHPTDFCDVVFSDTTVSSASELVYNVIQHCQLLNKMDNNVATCLYTGIMTDTGCFSFNSSNSSTFKVAAHLLDRGINKDAIFDNIFNNFSFNRMKLMGYCLSNKLNHLPQYRTAYISLTAQELTDHNFIDGDTEGFVNLPLSIENVIFSVLFIEKSDRIKISFRSKGKFKVNEMAVEYFRGGGHDNAAGGESYLTLKKTVSKFLNLLPNYEQKLQNT